MSAINDLVEKLSKENDKSKIQGMLNEYNKSETGDRYGLVWPDHTENVVERCKTEIPTLKMVNGRNILEITLKSENSQFSIIPTNENIFGYWVYVVVAPFSSPLESFQTEDLLNLWRFGKPDEIELYLSSETIKSLSILWGDPNTENIINVEEENLLSELWDNSNSIAIIPFERIEPRLKILTLDNMNPLEHEFSPSAYSLALPLSIIINSNVNISDQLHDFTNFSSDNLSFDKKCKGGSC